MFPHEMTREQIISMLRILGNELDKRGILGRIILAGGACMCLVVGG